MTITAEIPLPAASNALNASNSKTGNAASVRKESPQKSVQDNPTAFKDHLPSAENERTPEKEVGKPIEKNEIIGEAVLQNSTTDKKTEAKQNFELVFVEGVGILTAAAKPEIRQTVEAENPVIKEIPGDFNKDPQGTSEDIGQKIQGKIIDSGIIPPALPQNTAQSTETEITRNNPAPEVIAPKVMAPEVLAPEVLAPEAIATDKVTPVNSSGENITPIQQGPKKAAAAILPQPAIETALSPQNPAAPKTPIAQTGTQPIITPEPVPVEKVAAQAVQIIAQENTGKAVLVQAIAKDIVKGQENGNSNDKATGEKKNIFILNENSDIINKAAKAPAKGVEGKQSAQSNISAAQGQPAVLAKSGLPLELGQILSDSAGKFSQLTSPQLNTGLLSVQEVVQNTSQNNILKNINQPNMLPPQTSPEMAAKQIGMAIQKQVAGGIESFKLTLKPAELGQVEIKLDFKGEGKIITTVIVENERTLALLQKDQASLEKALEKAGFEAGNNDLNFTLNKQQHGQEQSQSADKGPDHGGADFFAATANNIIAQQNMKIAYSDNVLDIRI